MTVKLVLLALVVAFFIGIGVFIGIPIGRHLEKKEHPQPEGHIDEAYETPAIIETLYVETPAKIITKHITKTDTVLVNRNVYLPRSSKSTTDKSSALVDRLSTLATHPFYFSREGASFQMDITYRYSDQKFRFENMRFKSPKAKVVYKDRIFKLSSGAGYLRGLNGNSYIPLQPINLRVWKFNFKPTVMPYWDKIKEDYGFACGGVVEITW